MLSPAYLASCPDALVRLFAQVEQDILVDMARRLATYDYYIPSAQHQHQKLRAMGLMEEEIEAELAKLLNKAPDEIRRIMQDAVSDAIDNDAKIYAAAGMGPIDPVAMAGIRDIIRAGYDQTGGLFTNLTRTTAHTATLQFEDALDRAWLQISSGGFDYNTAIRRAIGDLSEQSVHAIKYPSGHKDRIEVAVRRAIVTGVNQTAGLACEHLMDELGVELVEVTAHSGARPEHAEWQGKVYSRKGRTRHYKNLVDATGYGTGGGLKGWNCSHDFFPYFEGAPRAYTAAQLREMNAKKITYNGEKMTEYDALQKQRAIERAIRRWKRELAACEAAKQPTDHAKAKISEWNAKMRDFNRQTGLKRDRTREVIG